MAEDGYYTLKRSTRSGKKWMVRVPTSSGRGKTVHFGDSTMQDFTQHKDTARRERYWSRHQRDNLDDPGSPGFWSWHALWGQSSNLKTAFAAAVRRAKKLGGAKRRNPDPLLPYSSDEVVAMIKKLHKQLIKHGIKAHERLNSFYLLLSGLVLEDGYNTVYWSVLDGHIPVAAGYIERDDEDPDDRFFWERNAFVLPDYQRRGIYKGVIGILNRLYGEIAQDTQHTEANAAFWESMRSGAKGARRNPDPLHERFDELCAMINTNATLVVDEEAALAGRDPRSPRAFAATDGETVFVRPKLAEQSPERIDGVLMHEIGHVILIQSGCEEHTERECDACAEGAFGVAICYDEDDVQTTGFGARPRPAHLDVEC